MSELYPIIFALLFGAILSAAVGLFLRAFNPAWWAKRPIKRAFYLAPVAGAVGIAVWATGVLADIWPLAFTGAALAALTVIILIALLLSLPASGIIHGLGYILSKMKKTIQAEPHKANASRRIFLKSSAAVFPIATIVAGADGFTGSFAAARIPRLRFPFANLPPQLEGFKILQISDCHLGYYVGLNDLEKLLVLAEPMQPDLVLVTGDLSDDLGALPDALTMISGLNPRWGTFACLGNHEYYRGIREVRQIFEKGPIPLLVETGVNIEVGGSALYIGGADDPRYLRRDNAVFLKNTVSASLSPAAEGSFKILMSHRPEAFDYSAPSGADLTLAGHTHGGQIGLGGRSAFESLLSYKYLWGHYHHANGNQLYTTAGVGHWFPFRLGCPPEAPLIELVSHI